MAVNVRIISLDAHVKRAATHPVRVVFPDAAFFPAVDFRKTSADDLLSEGLVTFAGYEAIKNGRKYHHELSTPGAVGLSLSYYNIAREFASKRSPVLVCEDDCLPHKDVPEVVAQLLQHQSRFDVAVLGSFGHVHGTKIAPCEFEGFGELKGGYFGSPHPPWTASWTRTCRGWRLGEKCGSCCRRTGVPPWPRRRLMSAPSRPRGAARCAISSPGRLWGLITGWSGFF